MSLKLSLKVTHSSLMQSSFKIMYTINFIQTQLNLYVFCQRCSKGKIYRLKIFFLVTVKGRGSNTDSADRQADTQTYKHCYATIVMISS